MSSTENFVTFLGIRNYSTALNTAAYTFVGGQSSTSLATTNVFTPSPLEVWRSPSGANRIIEWRFTTYGATPIGGIYLCHVRGFPTTGGVLIIEADGTTAYSGSSYIAFTLPINTCGDLLNLSDARLRRNIAWFSSQEYTRNYWRVTFDQTTGTQLLDLEVGFLGFSTQTYFGVNAAFGMSLGFADRSKLHQSAAGTIYADEYPGARTATISWNHLTKSSAIETLFTEVVRRKGITRPFFVSLFPQDNYTGWNPHEFYCRIGSPVNLVFNQTSTRQVAGSLTLVEVTG